MAKSVSAYAILLLITFTASVVDVQCKAKGSVRTYMPAEEPPYHD